MNYFTLEWWNGNQVRDLDYAPHAAYAERLAALRHRLPAETLRFVDNANLHDGTLRTMVIDAATATLVLLADDGSGGPALHRIEYLEVRRNLWHANPELGLAGPRGFGDWGYDEIDLAEAGHCVHRVLFSSGLEWQVEFRDLRWTCHDGISAADNPSLRSP